MARLSTLHWQQVRAQWETSTDAGYRWLCQAHGGIWPVSRETIRQRALSEGWTKRPAEAPPPRSGLAGIAGSGDFEGRGVFDPGFELTDLDLEEGPEAVRARLLRQHCRDWFALRRLASVAVVEGTVEAARRMEHHVRVLRLVQAGEVLAFGLDADRLDLEKLSDDQLEAILRRGRLPR